MIIFVNYSVGGVIGAFAAGLTSFVFLIAILTFTEVDGPKRQHVFAESIGYIFLTFGVANIASKEIVPKAYEWLQLSVPESERNFRGSE